MKDSIVVLFKAQQEQFMALADLKMHILIDDVNKEFQLDRKTAFKVIPFKR